MTAIATDLPSRVEETLAACPQFRIVVIGKSGVGKSSLISNIFNFAVDEIDIRHDRPGQADITYGHTSDKNMRFILHDSLGFEPGAVENWEIVENFLRERYAASLPERVHAIWLCIEAPRNGSRLLETSDENLLRLAAELNIPAIAVFTKYDVLVKEHYLEARAHDVPKSKIDYIAKKNAEISFNSRIQDFRSSAKVPCVKVSSHPEAERLKSLRELVNITRQCLHSLEGDLWFLWATAQQVSANQKAQLSISEGFKKFWMDLGRSTVFQGHTLIECVQRIHNDILEVWNFNDPLKLLSGNIFSAKMVQLLEPLLSEYTSPIGPDDPLENAVGNAFAQFLHAAGIGIVAFRYLYGKYQRIPLTARYLGAYIVDLTMVLYRLFMDTLVIEPPRPLSEELISGAVACYKDLDSEMVHNRVLAMTSGNLPLHFEQEIADLVLELLPNNIPKKVGQMHDTHQCITDFDRASNSVFATTRWIGAERALQHVRTQSVETANFFSKRRIPESEYAVHAGFDETLIEAGIGYLEQIHVFVSSEVANNPSETFLSELGQIFSPFSAILFTKLRSHHIPVFKEDQSVWDFDELVRVTASQFIGDRANDAKPPVGITGSLSQSHSESNAPSSFTTGGSGNQTRNKNEKKESRKGKGRDDDKAEKGEEDSDKDSEPESPPRAGGKPTWPIITFKVNSRLYPGQKQDNSQSISQYLNIEGEITVQATPQSLDPPRFATRRIEFTRLKFGTVRRTANTAYRQFHTSIIIDSLQKWVDIIDVKPERSREFDMESKEVSGTKSGWSWGASVAAAISILTKSVTITGSGNRTGESSFSSERKRYNSRIMQQNMEGVVSWGFPVYDRFLQKGGFIIGDRPTVHFKFVGTSDIPADPPKHTDVEVLTYWSMIHDSDTDGSGSNLPLLLSKPPSHSNLCKIVTFNIPSNLPQESHYRNTLDVYLGHYEEASDPRLAEPVTVTPGISWGVNPPEETDLWKHSTLDLKSLRPVNLVITKPISHTQALWLDPCSVCLRGLKNFQRK